MIDRIVDFYTTLIKQTFEQKLSRMIDEAESDYVYKDFGYKPTIQEIRVGNVLADIYGEGEITIELTKPLAPWSQASSSYSYTITFVRDTTLPESGYMPVLVFVPTDGAVVDLHESILNPYGQAELNTFAASTDCDPSEDAM